MADVLTPEQRQLNMSRIRGRDTKPEMLIRRGLHARGLRYRLQDRSLPGRPDLVFPRHHAVILVHGCFWHGHDCPMFRLPATRREFWSAKIDANRLRDAKAHDALLALGWRVLTVWECSLKGKERLSFGSVLEACVGFIEGSQAELTISGARPPAPLES
ncbi:MAG: DNA mismatch endonuclease Vsr [Burkholderiaceae bacterium]|nr:DNA mismatch endonuclease Vsr [Burkholderiaceae bacterium]